MWKLTSEEGFLTRRKILEYEWNFKEWRLNVRLFVSYMRLSVSACFSFYSLERYAWLVMSRRGVKKTETASLNAPNSFWLASTWETTHTATNNLGGNFNCRFWHSVGYRVPKFGGATQFSRATSKLRSLLHLFSEFLANYFANLQQEIVLNVTMVRNRISSEVVEKNVESWRTSFA